MITQNSAGENFLRLEDRIRGLSCGFGASLIANLMIERH
jgi:hypothetical protein